MKNTINTCVEKIYGLSRTVNSIGYIYAGELSKNDQTYQQKTLLELSEFHRLTLDNTPDISLALYHAKKAATRALSFGKQLSKNDAYGPAVISISTEITDQAVDFINYLNSEIDQLSSSASNQKSKRNEHSNQHIDIDSKQEAHSYYERQLTSLLDRLRPEIDRFEKEISDGRTEIDLTREKNADSNRRTKSELSSLAETIEELRSDISTLHEQLTAESQRSTELSNDAIKVSNQAKLEIDQLLSDAASDLLRSEYSKTAYEEEKTADIMRYASLGCMALTGAVLFYALYESLSSELDWKQSVLKMFIAIALSVPAAYLARESAKHRNQQHINRRIALDLKAIPSYIRPLDHADQTKIVSEVASRIFGAHNNETSPESFPFNMNEVIIALIDKIPTKKE